MKRELVFTVQVAEFQFGFIEWRCISFAALSACLRGASTKLHDIGIDWVNSQAQLKRNFTCAKNTNWKHWIRNLS